MIKFLSIVIFLALSYLSVIAVSKYDTVLSILLFDYRIEISFFLVIIIFICILCVSSLGLRIIAAIFKIPYLIAEKLAGYKRNSHTKLLLDSYANMIMGKQEIAQKTIAKIDANTSYKEYRDHINLLKALSNRDSDRNIYLMHSLLSNKQYHDFAARKIAQRMYDQGFYEQSLGFIEHANVDINNNEEAIYLLILLYAELNIWDSFSIYIEKYNDIFGDKIIHNSKDIAVLYLKGAKYNLAQGEEEESVEFLKKTLEYDPLSIEAIEILCTLNISRGLNYQNFAILESAFSLAPSFELFELYYKSATLDHEEIYEKFYGLVDAKSYKDVFLSIAAYLKLFDKIDSLISCEI